MTRSTHATHARFNVAHMLRLSNRSIISALFATETAAVHWNHPFRVFVRRHMRTSCAFLRICPEPGPTDLQVSRARASRMPQILRNT